MKNGIVAITLVLIVVLGVNGVAYSMWKDDVTLLGKITTWSGGGGGSGACVEIQKTLYGAYTDPTNGKDLCVPTNLIRIGSNSGTLTVGEIGCPPTNFPTKFKLCINVTNCGPTELYNVVVTDRLELQFTNINHTKSDGSDKVVWSYVQLGQGGFHSYLTWEIGNLTSGESATLCIWIRTTQNPNGFYHPTSANANYTVNIGATVNANSEAGSLTAQTEGIVLEIGGFVQPNIAEILTDLPYSTPWANDHIDPT